MTNLTLRYDKRSAIELKWFELEDCAICNEITSKTQFQGILNESNYILTHGNSTFKISFPTFISVQLLLLSMAPIQRQSAPGLIKC